MATAILFPALMLTLTLTVQAGMVFYARGIAGTAARQGVDAARVYDGSAAAGQSASRQFLGQAQGGLRNPTVTVDRGSREVTVTVRGEVLSLLPGLSPVVRATVSAPVERTVE